MTNIDEKEDNTVYKVVLNHEEQYSIWPAERENPLGWRDDGKSGSKAECLDYIKVVWTDMRPLSLRKKMEAAPASEAAEPHAADPSVQSTAERTEDNLVARLSDGSHPVEASLRPEKTAQALKACIDRRFVHIKFTDTRGGTELGIRLDAEASDLSRADFENQTGTVRLVGGLTLNYTPVRCTADIDLQTLRGQGHLEPLEP